MIDTGKLTIALMTLAALAFVPAGSASVLDLPMIDAAGVVEDTHDHNELLAAPAADLADVNVPERCQRQDSHYVGGPWSETCTGVRGGCVGTWYTQGTHDAQLRHVTTYSHSDTTCAAEYLDLTMSNAAFGVPAVFGPTEMSMAASPAVDAADVNVPERCQRQDSHYVGGPWSETCTGVRGGCVGTWYSQGTHDAQLRHVRTYSHSDTTCLATVTDAIATLIAAPSAE